MSGIYIPGMEMPKSCWDCGALHEEDYCYAGNMSIDRGHSNDRSKYCPLIAVPDHGRLIDADALSNDGWVLHKQVMRMGGFAIHEMPLNCPSLPTIIPADKESDENDQT